MGRRVDILQAFTSWLQSGTYLDAPLPPRGVARGFRWLDSINEFPYITYNVQDSSLDHIGDNYRYYALSIALRAYVRGENAQSLLDQLMFDIESRINSFVENADPALEIVTVGIDSTHSDEGLMDPYGVTDMRITLSYRQSSFV